MATIDVKNLIEDDIFDLLGLENLDDKTKDDLRINILESVSNRILLRVADLLNDEEIKHWENLLDEGNNEKIVNYLQEKNIDLKKIAIEESLIYKRQLVDTLNKAKNQQ
jgi:hypothetical protein